MKRSASIDALKIIMAFLVVCLHMPFPGRLGILVNVIARIAVPCFFVISGFFSYKFHSTEDCNKLSSNSTKFNFIIRGGGI